YTGLAVTEDPAQPLIATLKEALPFQMDVLPLVQDYVGPEDQPHIVIDAQRCGKEIVHEKREAYVERLKKVSLEDLLEMNAAVHKQYSDGGGLEDITFCDPDTKSKMLTQ